MTLALLLLGLGVAPREFLNLAASLTGLAAVVGILAGFGPRGTLSLRPWILTAIAVLAYAAALLMIEKPDGSILLNLLGLVAVAGAVATVLTQRTTASVAERVEVQHRRHLHRPRWGAAWIAGSVAVALLSLRTVAILGSVDASVLKTPSTEGGTITIQAPYLPSAVLGRVEDPRITESSGLVASPSTKGVFWTHNDSGDDPWLYCLRADGASCGRWSATGASAIDWEDVAAFTSGGSPMLYVGDIGDNDGVRPNVTIYEISEPRVSDLPERRGGTAPVRSIELRYPNGPRDAEAMAVHPTTGDLYVMVKDGGSAVSVYTARSPLRSQTALTRIATNHLFGNLLDRTGLDISPNGRRVAVATYGGIFELTQRPNEDFDGIWDNEPTVVEDSISAQIEAIAYAADGRALFFTEEGNQPRFWTAERI